MLCTAEGARERKRDRAGDDQRGDQSQRGGTVALGDISIYKSSTVTGRARVELSAWSADRERVTIVPATEASRYYRNVTVLTFIGPFRFTNLDEEPRPGDEP